MGFIQLILLVIIIIVVTPLIGGYMVRVFAGEKTWLDPVLRPLERIIYQFCGINPQREMRWTSYTLAMLGFSTVSVILLFLILRLQGILPLNPQHLPGLRPDLAFNTAVSFVTNTNWQSYIGEQTMSYFSQMVGLAWQNFVSAATGIAIAMALIRGLTRHSVEEVGNYWVDLTRSILWVLLPLSLVFALVLVSQGVIQNFMPYINTVTMEGAHQIIPQGPVASQEAIKMIGTNGGGFFNANSAHPYENPTPLTNFLQMLAIFIIPAGLTYTFGRFAKASQQGWVLFSAMMVLFLAGFAVINGFEQAGNPMLTKLGVDQTATAFQAGGNMEGKEVRFGISSSTLFAAITTDASCGAVNSMHDSYTPLAGGMAMLNIALGEIVFGGVGAGFVGIIIFALLAVFIAGLMVGRTPEYLGKKVEAKEMKLAMLYILISAIGILGLSAIAVMTQAGRAGLLNSGPHGLSEILYTFTSAIGNNGSAFAGINANTPFYNISIGLAMLIGRFLTIIPLMAIAGSLVSKKTVPATNGTFPTTGGMFVGLLVGVILIVGALTFFPTYALGPIVEHFLMHAGRLW
ncbi:MAG: potassium-transporting ATPase subunit KdpA [bacterium]